MLLQAHGLGRVRANTALINWHEQHERRRGGGLTQGMRMALRFGVNVVMHSADAVIRGINPNNIESITVLKDPGETAMYGSRGANGVILIKTKRGVG